MNRPVSKLTYCKKSYKCHNGIEKEHSDILGVLLLVEFFTGSESVKQKHHSENEAHTKGTRIGIGCDQSPNLILTSVNSITLKLT
jgi:hypothetical protein